MTKEEIIKEYFSTLGKKCLQSMTPKQRVERAKKASKVRWSKCRIPYPHDFPDHPCKMCNRK